MFEQNYLDYDLDTQIPSSRNVLFVKLFYTKKHILIETETPQIHQLRSVLDFENLLFSSKSLVLAPKFSCLLSFKNLFWF